MESLRSGILGINKLDEEISPSTKVNLTYKTSTGTLVNPLCPMDHGEVRVHTASLAPQAFLRGPLLFSLVDPGMGPTLPR